MKKDFVNFVNALIEAAPEVAENLMTENVKAYLDVLTNEENEKPVLTDNGKLILKYVQDNPVPMFKSKDIAEGLFISSRTVSGAMRKLVTDGFMEKLGKDPVVYGITEKGKNFKIED